MKNSLNKLTDAGELRRRAEQQLTEIRRRAEQQLKGADKGSIPDADTARKLLHELQVHQIELEMQNQELRAIQDRAEELLLRYTALYELAPVGHFTLDRDGIIQQMNLAAAKLLGVARASLERQRLLTFVSSEFQPVFKAWLTQVFASHAREICEVALLPADKRPLFAQIEAIANEDGLMSRIVVTDISARKQAERELIRRYEELQELNNKLKEAHDQLLQAERMASIGQLAAGVAHEINNPVGYVYSNLGTLERYVQDMFNMLAEYEQAESSITDDAVRARLQAARKKLDIAFLQQDLRALMDESKEGITRVKNIVQDLKDFSHVDTADEWYCADLHKGLNSTLNIIHNQIKYTVEVVKEYGDIATVECLPSQLNQVFMNLLVNAAQAIAQRGTITVRTGQQTDEVWVEIADTGHGIAAENLQRIFDPFYTTKPIGLGTGLGLSLSYSIIQKHHGRIEVHSEAGKGTTFRVWLPLQQPRAEGV